MNNENFDPNQEAAAPQTPEEPAQTPPTPQASYSYPPLPRTRRIGTLTMGFALIVTGIIALVATFYPAFDIFTVLKLSPIIFVFLGLEILIGYFRHKGEKLKFVIGKQPSRFGTFRFRETDIRAAADKIIPCVPIRNAVDRVSQDVFDPRNRIGG